MRRFGAEVGLILCLVVWSRASWSQEEVWIFLRDKPDGRGGRLAWQALGEGHPREELELPVDPVYLARLREMGVEVRFCSRWFNAVSARATAVQQEWLRRQPFVEELRPVSRFRRPEWTMAEGRPKAADKEVAVPDYGLSFDQLEQIGVVALHLLGYQGRGVRVALLDDGFHYRHRSLAQLRIVAERDFVNGDSVVTDQDGQPVTGDESRSSQNLHGAQVLSLLAGCDPGRFFGVAPEAEYILAKTEDDSRELPVEEDRWIAGLEWADSLGAQVVNSSLGYNLWDDGSGYTYEQMDGATALVTRAAELAVRQGIVVVAAAGNEGDKPWQYVTAPADGPGVISVGSVDVPKSGLRHPLLAATSSRGPTADGRLKPDVVAPGEGVVVADIRGGDYLRASGTSFAAPLVSGVCALLLQIHPTWTPAQVQEALRQTATDLGPVGPDTAYGWGQVDALRASGLQLLIPQQELVGAPFPNPATGDVVYFPFQLTRRDRVELRIFDLAGNLVYARREDLSVGAYANAERALSWEIGIQEREQGTRIANGLFFYQLRASSFDQTGKIALMRRGSRRIQ